METAKNGLAVVGGVAVAASLVYMIRKAVAARKESALAAEVEKLNSELLRERATADVLKKAAAAVAATAGAGEEKQGDSKPVRVYIDGCFDMMHFGHSNALRQARAVGTQLVVGLIGDDEIIKNKGSPPVMPFEERLIAVQSCKFVDEVIPNAPYDLTPEWTRKLVDTHHIDYIVHGDDPCITADGKDAYETAKKLGVFKTIKRTEGISTTDIVGRMLLMTRQHHIRQTGAAEGKEGEGTPSKVLVRRQRAMSAEEVTVKLSTRQFLPTSHRIVQFASGVSAKATDRVVYCVGAWDLFNAGHIEFLKAAKAQGDFLLVGIHTDDLVNRHRGAGWPVLNLHERALSVLSCRYVDEIIIGAPWEVTADLMQSMHISVVCKGTISDQDELHNADADVEPETVDPYALAKSRDMLKVIPSSSKLTALRIFERVLADHKTFLDRYARKAKGEEDYQKNKTFVEET